MGLASEFKEFAMKGNVVDMAVGVIIGAAFGKIVSSLVSDVVTPPLGLAIGGVKYRVESGLFKRMLEPDKPLYLDFRDAFKLARDLVG